jgi:Ricin-type beta-trefoil lectin domain
MWSQTPNPNYDPKNPIESEEGDPSTIRTQFNVLLKQNKNGNWKASLERDPEVKDESLDITETEEDKQIYKDLFATDNADNAFTATEEVLIEDANTAGAEPSKNISNTTTISSISSSQVSIISSQIVPTISPIENLDLPVAKEKTSWLQNILSFGSISANAQVAQQYNYSWPWKGGDTWYIGQGWHECEPVSTINSNYILNTLGCSLDIQPANLMTTNEILAPITTTITRACQAQTPDAYQGSYTIGKMTIVHIDANSMVLGNGVLVRKGQKIGNVFIPPIGTTNQNPFSSKCGTTGGQHIHLKISDITDPLFISNPASTVPFNSRNLAGSITLDGYNIQGPKLLPLRADGLQNYNAINGGTQLYQFTSQNYPNTNTYTGKIKSFTTPNKIFDIYDFNGNNGAAVQLYEAGTNNPVNQRWYFDDVNRQIKGMNGKCLEVSSTNYIKMQDCTTTTSQKWQFNFNNQIISEANGMCIEAQSGIVDGSLLIVNTCNTSNNNQKWNFADIVTLTSGATRINTRINLAGPWNTTTKLMNKDLNTNNKIPLLQPFCTAPWNYCGTENIPNRANIDQSAVDWVLIEIKNASGITVQRKAALITNDAFLTDANGINSPGNFYPVKFNSITSPGYYKVIVRHRNHLAIATDSNVYLTQSTSPSIYNNIDLTQNVNVKAANQSNLGTNTTGQTVYGMRLGNVNGDDKINVLDVSASLNAPDSTSYSIYDANLNSITNVVDTGLVRNAPDAFEAI